MTTRRLMRILSFCVFAYVAWEVLHEIGKPRPAGIFGIEDALIVALVVYITWMLGYLSGRE